MEQEGIKQGLIQTQNIFHGGYKYSLEEVIDVLWNHDNLTNQQVNFSKDMTKKYFFKVAFWANSIQTVFRKDNNVTFSKQVFQMYSNVIAAGYFTLLSFRQCLNNILRFILIISM